MKLLVSVTNEEEAISAVEGGAHIIDVKNPREGSLGASFPRVIRRVREVVPRSIEVSSTIGDLPNLPGTASLAALGAAVSGSDYIKAGLFGVKTVHEAMYLMREICRSVKEYNASLKVIAAGYADYKNLGCLNPLELPEVAYAAGADGVMVDVKVKCAGKSVFSHFTEEELRGFVNRAHKLDLIAAIAGSLRRLDVKRVYALGADIIGVRGAVCGGGDRLNGTVQGHLVREFIMDISRCMRGY
ncbi:MAG: (5-formylfuran-3-yl)methyl phosphate synthase [Candidatus Bathyarchaeia archaeon]